MTERRFGPIRWIPGENRGKYPYCHSLFLEEAGVLIDPASDRETLRGLREQGAVKAVWLTHWHEDHLMHLDLFEDVPLCMAAADAEPLSDIERFLDWYGMEPDAGQTRDTFRQMLLDQFHFRPRRPDRLLRDGEIVEAGPVTVEVIGTPGHTPGHLAFRFREPQILFLGDYDLTAFGPWYGDLYSSLEATAASVARLREIPARTWLASHGPGVFQAPPGDLWDRYLDVIRQRERKLLRLLDAPRTRTEIVEAWIVYGKRREPYAFFAFAEWAILGKHLERLIASGEVCREGETYRRSPARGGSRP